MREAKREREKQEERASRERESGVRRDSAYEDAADLRPGRSHLPDARA